MREDLPAGEVPSVRAPDLDLADPAGFGKPALTGRHICRSS